MYLHASRSCPNQEENALAQAHLNAWSRTRMCGLMRGALYLVWKRLSRSELCAPPWFHVRLCWQPWASYCLPNILRAPRIQILLLLLSTYLSTLSI
eukprot:11068735-Alexandrium_andersonii.AAC.1